MRQIETTQKNEFEIWVDRNIDNIVENSKELGCSNEFIDVVETDSVKTYHRINRTIYEKSNESESTEDALIKCINDEDDFFTHIWDGDTERAWHASDAEGKDILTSVFGVSVRCVS